MLIVDTVGFLPGVLTGPVRHGSKLHIVERFTLDPKTMKLTRAYTADDLEYLKGHTQAPIRWALLTSRSRGIAARTRRG